MSRPRTRTSSARPAPPRLAAVECPLCAHPNARDAKFCNSCGARVDLVTCRACEAINSRESAACYSCGASLSRRAGADRTTRATTASPLPEPASEIVPSAPVETSSTADDAGELPGPLSDRELPTTPGSPLPAAAPPPVPDSAIATAYGQSTATPAPRRRWMRSMVLLVPIAAAVGFLAYPRGDLEPSVTPRPTSPSPGSAAGTVASPAASATGATAAPSDLPNGAPAQANAPDALQAQPASPDAAVVEAPRQVDKPPSSLSSPRARDTRQPSRSRTQRTARGAPVTEAPSDATSATLREQISAGSRRSVSCTVDAAALGLCATR